MSQQIAENIENVKNRIREAALRAGRDPLSVKLVAVSKMHSIDSIRVAFAAGQHAFGENYVQEALNKISNLPEAEWHLIGSLQSKKAKQVAGKFTLIHSVDREKLIDELAKAASAQGVVQDILLQINIGGEESKSGVDPSEAPRLIERISQHPSLRLRGLMALPPLSDEERVSRAYFSELRNLSETFGRDCLSPTERACFTELSMGTSSDFEWAVLEGATMVRVGTSIFGERSYV
jgi:pyridoxal phosphate enzyme (YggS family)